MDIQQLFIKANNALQSKMEQARPEQLEMVLPDDFTWAAGQKLRQVMNVCAFENACVPDVLAGKPLAGTNAELSEDLLRDDPQGNYARFTEQANRAVESESDMDKIVHISYGDFPARDYLRDISIQRSMSAFDVARVLGNDTKLPDDLVQGLWDITLPMADLLRDMGVFKAKIEVPEDASLQDQLMGLTGRQP